MNVTTAITINCKPSEAYGYWHDFAKLPTFMTHLESVEPIDGGKWHWKAKAPAGTNVEWDAEIVEDEPDRHIRWRSTQDADVVNAGSVRFMPAPADQGTEIRVEIIYNAPGGRLGTVVAKLFGEDPRQQVKDDLRRFKQVLETGEVVRSEGTPEGSKVQRLLKQRPAQPASTTN